MKQSSTIAFELYLI